MKNLVRAQIKCPQCRIIGRHVVSRHRSVSFCISENWNIFTGTNSFKHAESKSELEFPLHRPAQFSHKLQFYVLSREGARNCRKSERGTRCMGVICFLNFVRVELWLIFAVAVSAG